MTNPKSLWSKVILAAALLTLGLPIGAMAFPSLVNTRYALPELPVSYSYGCTDCHVSEMSGGSSDCNLDSNAHPWSPCFNEFGLEYRMSGWSTLLGSRDTDGDGISNSNELDGLGGSAGFPVEAEADCDMATCAASTHAAIACVGNVLCSATVAPGPASTGINAHGYSYAFNFICVPGAEDPPSASDLNWSNNCRDISECLGNPCGAGAGTCTERPLSGWTSPGYDCTCNSGYEETGLTCENVNECLLGLDDCGPNTQCVDSVGSFQCVAPVPALHPYAAGVMLLLIGSAAYLTILRLS